MSIIFIVTDDADYHDMSNIGVFETFKEAESFVKDNPRYGWRDPKVQEWLIGLDGVQEPNENHREGECIR